MELIDLPLHDERERPTTLRPYLGRRATLATFVRYYG